MKGILREEFEVIEFFKDRLWVIEGRKEGFMKIGRELGLILLCVE